MFKKGLLFVILIAMIGASPARADPAIANPACQMIDKVLGTFSLIRDIQIDQSDRRYAENMSKLATLVDQISLPALVPPQSRDGLSTESAALFYYLSSLREAVVGAKYGYDDHAKLTLNNGITKEFTASIKSLDDYWQCTPQAPPPNSEARNMGEAVGAKTAQGDFAKPLLQAPPDRDRTDDNRLADNRLSDNRLSDNRLAGRVKFGLVTPLSNTSLSLALVVFIALFGMLFYAHKRTKNFKVRDARRVVRTARNVRIGKSVFQIIIVDISMNGAKIQHAELINKQKKLQIELDGTWYPGQIKWRNQMFAGIKFDRSIGTQTFNTILQSSDSSMGA